MSNTTKTFNYILFVTILWLITMAPTLVQGEKAILLDTRRALSDLGWTMSAGSEWQEMTSSDPSGNERRMLMVCEITQSNQDNWMRSQFINVQGAKRVYVEMEFTIRSCEDVPNVATCKETFNLYYYETDRDEATSTFPPWEESSYTKVDTIAADQRFRPGSSNTNFETRDIGPINKAGIYLAIQDTGGCVALMHIRVYYKYCDRNTTNLATFDKTTTGEDVTSLVEAKGSCVRNAVAEKADLRPSLYCNGEGQWTVPSGTCACTAGYQPNKQRTQCFACPVRAYKSIAANRPCRRCPDYSTSLMVGATVCDCMTGYFRAPTDTADDNCTKPPTKPVNLYSKLNGTSVALTWSMPLNTGGRNDLYYELHCLICKEKFVECRECGRQVQHVTKEQKITAQQTVVSSLSAYSYYKLKVCAMNGVTKTAKASDKLLNNCAESIIETNQAAPSVVIGFRSSQVMENWFTLEWEEPTNPNGVILDYEVSVDHVGDVETPGKSANSNPFRLNRTNEKEIVITNLQAGEIYLAKIRARTSAGYGPYCAPIRVKTKSASLTQTQENGGEIAGKGFSIIHLVLIISGSVLFLIILVAGGVFCRRRQVKKFDKKKLDPEKLGTIYNGNRIELKRNFLQNHKTYVDPTTYEDPQRAIRDFTKEIDSLFVKIEEVIGGGEFGEVCKGKLCCTNKPEQEVAIKTLKMGYNPQQKLDFLGEASIMGQFDHANVIHLEGVVTKSRPLMIITEYMENGSLDAFLRNHDNQLSVLQLVGMLRDISEGMKYLSEMGYVHRDLAARNVLVDSLLVCKVSDFGMSRVLEDDEDAAYTTRGGKIPIRWTAPEAITFRKFTSSSDVWSFGIVMWEVMSYGERPYWGMSNQDVMNAIENGYRLPAPMDCPQVQHLLMLDCWKKDRNQRPKFDQIKSSLEKMIEEPEQLKITVANRRRPIVPTSNIIPERPSSALPMGSGKLLSGEPPLSSTPLLNGKLNSGISKSNPNETSPLMESSTQEQLQNDIQNKSSNNLIATWLEQIGLSQYKEKFTRRGYAKLEQLSNLNSKDLIDIGVEPRHLKTFLSGYNSRLHNFEEREPNLPSYTESTLSYSGISV